MEQQSSVNRWFYTIVSILKKQTEKGTAVAERKKKDKSILEPSIPSCWRDSTNFVLDFEEFEVEHNQKWVL